MFISLGGKNALGAQLVLCVVCLAPQIRLHEAEHDERKGIFQNKMGMYGVEILQGVPYISNPNHDCTGGSLYFRSKYIYIYIYIYILFSFFFFTVVSLHFQSEILILQGVPYISDLKSCFYGGFPTFPV